MKSFHLNSNLAVTLVFNKYPDHVRKKLLLLRRIIIETAEEIPEIKELEETLKWGEPSYLVKNGSTIRIDWKKKTPNQYAMYFKCTSRLVPTFKAIYGSLFSFEGNRAIYFKMDVNVPESALKKCITAALMYHQVKHLPNLGM